MEIKATYAQGTESLFAAMEHGLSNLTRDKLTIKFIGGLRLGKSRTEAMRRIINVLLFKVSQWTIILPQNIVGLSGVVEKFGPRIHVPRGDNYVLITNKEGKIGSCSESWMIND